QDDTPVGTRADGGNALDSARTVRARARRTRQVHLLSKRRAGRRLLLPDRVRPERLVPPLQRRKTQDGGRRFSTDGLRAGLRLLHERRHADVAGQWQILTLAARALWLLPRLLSRDPESHPAGGAAFGRDEGGGA